MCRAGRAIRSTALLPIKRLLETGRGISLVGGRRFLTAAHRLLHVGLPLLIPRTRCMTLTVELLALQVYVPARMKSAASLLVEVLGSGLLLLPQALRDRSGLVSDPLGELLVLEKLALPVRQRTGLGQLLRLRSGELGGADFAKAWRQVRGLADLGIPL